MTTSNVFYPGFVSDDMRKELMESPRDMWAVVTGIASGTGYALRVSNFHDPVSSLVCRATFRTPYGFECLRVEYTKDTGVIAVSIQPAGSDGWRTIIVSKKVKYVIKNLFEDRTGKPAPQRSRAVSVTALGDNIREFISSWERYPLLSVSRILREFRDKAIYEQARNTRSNSQSLPDNVIGDICKAVFDDKNVFSLQPETIEFMRNLRVQLNDKQASTDAASQTIRDMFCRDKWLIGYSVDKTPVIVASINLSSIVEKYMNAGDTLLNNIPYTLDESMVQFDMRPRAYPSMNYIDEQHRNAIQSSLTFLKVAVSNNVRYPPTPRDGDPDMLLPLEEVYAPDSGAYVLRQWNAVVRAWLLVDK